MRDGANAVTRIPSSEIYRGRRIIGRAIGTEGTDWCVVQLDRPVTNHRFVSIRRTGRITADAGVHVIGHPSGILDTYGGNSGSPVYSGTSHEVEGILVRGETDYVRVGNCFRSNVCPANGCRGRTGSTPSASSAVRNRRSPTSRHEVARSGRHPGGMSGCALWQPSRS